MPVGGAAGEQLHEAEAQALQLHFEGLAQGLLGRAHMLDAVQGAAFGIGHARELGHELGHADGAAFVAGHVAAAGAGGGLLAQQGGGGHLAAGHAVDGVVDEDAGDELAAVGRVDGLGQTDGAHVAVALIGEDNAFGAGAGGHGAGTAVGGFEAVHVEVVVSEGGAAHGGHQDGPVGHAQLVQHLAHQAVGDAVVAAGAVVGHALVEHGIGVEDQGLAILGHKGLFKFVRVHLSSPCRPDGWDLPGHRRR